MTAFTALAVAGETRLVPLMTCETVETDTPASRATSAIVDTSLPGLLAVPPLGAAFLSAVKLTYRNVCATVSTPLASLESAELRAHRRAAGLPAGSPKRPESAVSRQAGQGFGRPFAVIARYKMKLFRRSTRALFATLALCALGFAHAASADPPIAVTPDNFARAESDLYFSGVVKDGGFGKFMHRREPTPVAKQTVIRMNRDTLYSAAVFDLDAGPVTITLPDPGKRFLSMQVIDEDEYSPEVVYGAGVRTLTKEQIGTRYVRRRRSHPRRPERSDGGVSRRRRFPAVAPVELVRRRPSGPRPGLLRDVEDIGASRRPHWPTRPPRSFANKGGLPPWPSGRLRDPAGVSRVGQGKRRVPVVGSDRLRADAAALSSA